MTLSISTISLIQKAGAAIYAAREELSAEAQKQVTQLTSSMSADPFSLGTDHLFEQWKTLSRLGKELEQIDLQLRDIHATLGALVYESGQDRSKVTLSFSPSPALPGPRGRTAVPQAIDDVQVLSDVAMPKVKVRGELRGNNAKLFEYLQGVLGADEFTHLHQRTASEQTGIPMGSMGYSIKQLLARGLILEGQKGSFKLR